MSELPDRQPNDVPDDEIVFICGFRLGTASRVHEDGVELYTCMAMIIHNQDLHEVNMEEEIDYVLPDVVAQALHDRLGAKFANQKPS